MKFMNSQDELYQGELYIKFGGGHLARLKREIKRKVSFGAVKVKKDLGN